MGNEALSLLKASSKRVACNKIGKTIIRSKNKSTTILLFWLDLGSIRIKTWIFELSKYYLHISSFSSQFFHNFLGLYFVISSPFEVC